jgi:hypothetical protein
MSGAAAPFTQMQPLGWRASALTAVSLPSSTVAITPQRDVHMAQ